MDRQNLGPGTHGSKPLLRADIIRRARLRELALGWARFFRFLEHQRRLDAGEPLLRLLRDEDRGR